MIAKKNEDFTCVCSYYVFDKTLLCVYRRVFNIVDLWLQTYMQVILLL